MISRSRNLLRTYCSAAVEDLACGLDLTEPKTKPFNLVTMIIVVITVSIIVVINCDSCYEY